MAFAFKSLDTACSTLVAQLSPALKMVLPEVDLSASLKHPKQSAAAGKAEDASLPLAGSSPDEIRAEVAKQKEQLKAFRELTPLLDEFGELMLATHRLKSLQEVRDRKVSRRMRSLHRDVAA